MSTTETTTPKSHHSGSWKVVRSKAVPSNVTSLHSDGSIPTPVAGVMPPRKSDEGIFAKLRKSTAYFETSDSSFSKP